MYLLTVRVLRNHGRVHTLRGVGLADVVTMAGLLNYIALLDLIGVWSDFDLFVAYVVVVLLGLHFVGLEALTRDA